MYSGTDPIAGTPASAPGTGGLPAWAGMGLNAAGFPAGNSDSVDWAALAQQWIIMKEAVPPTHAPMPVQPPSASENSHTAVDMVVEHDTDSPQNNGNSVPVPPAPIISSPGVGQWNWSLPPPNWTAPPVPNFGAPGLLQTPKPPPLLPTPPQQHQTYNNFNQNFVPNWNSNAGQMEAKIIRPHNKRFSKVNVPVPAPAKQSLPSLLSQPLVPNVPPPSLIPHLHHSSPVLPTLDAARRKQLPAWIRDGLEKMERDKQRQMERLERDRQRALLAPNEYDMLLGERMESHLAATGVVPSKFNDDMEENGNDIDNSKQEVEDSEDEDTRARDRIQQPLSHEELMITVRRTMTEILLKVTNEGIKAACTEELQRFLRKQQRIRASKAAVAGGGLFAGASATKLAGTLGGLAAYADYSSDDSSSESDDDDDGKSRSQLDAAAVSVSDDDSDSHLQETIRRRKAEFSKTEREIEHRLYGGKARSSRDRSASSTASSNKSRTSSQDSRSSESTADIAASATDEDAASTEAAAPPAADYAQVDATHRGSGDSRRRRSQRRSRTKTPTRDVNTYVKSESKRRSSTNSNKDKSKEKEVVVKSSDKGRARTASDNKSKSSKSSRHNRSTSPRDKRHRSDRRRSSSSVSSSSRSRSKNRHKNQRRTRSRSRDRSSRKSTDQRRSRSTDKGSSRHNRSDRSDRSERRNANSSRRRSSRSSSSASSTSTRRRRKQLDRQDSRQKSSRRSRSRSRSRSKSKTSAYRRHSGRYSRSRSRSRDRSRRK